MITLRRSDDRGHADFGWLETRHSFSFGRYYDPRHMGFRSLRVLNEDRVKPGAGFPTHPHDNMEIVTYVLDGALEHKDSTGTGSVVRAGDLQRMSAGTGVTHSEFNASAADPLHFFQVWLLPEKQGLAPGYEQKGFSADERRGRLRLVGSRDGRDGSVTIHQDVGLYSSLLEPGESVRHELSPGRHAWLQIARGSVTANGTPLAAGDGAAISDEAELTIESSDASELLLFDLA